MDDGTNSPGPISLCLTVLNEATNLPAFIDALEAQTLKPQSVIVVDGGSGDGTTRILRDWGASSAMRVDVIEAPGANISEGRNLAIAAATSEWIAVTDAGTVPNPDWLDKLAKRMRPKVSVVSGFFEPQAGTLIASTIGAVITPVADELKAGAFLPSSRSVAFRRRAWADAGGYPEWLDYCEDLVFDLAMKRSGAAFVMAPDAVVRWDARATLGAFGKQYYRYARGDGKAGLYARRHLIRYGAYVVGAGLLVAAGRSRAPWPIAALVAGAGMYLAKFFRRVKLRRGDQVAQPMAAYALTPIVVMVGDVAKMLGYPAGLTWRRRSGRRKGVDDADR